MMKHRLLIASLVLPTLLFGQTTVTVTTGPTNTLQTYYSLQNGVQAQQPLADWDLAFEIAGFTSSIRVNTAKGLLVYEAAPVSEWASVNVPNEANWVELQNAEDDWSVGALNYGNDLDQPDGVNVGWGTYNMITHTIAGTKVYVIALGNGSYKKLRINSLISGTFSFTHADLDGSNEQTGTLVKSGFSAKNFGYFSFANGVLDPEPPTASWDLLFTKYIGFVPTAYPVAGVLQNKNVQALQVDGVDPAIADWWGGDFSSDINIIGSDWKSFNMTTFMYEYAQDRTYFVQDQAGNIWKLVFTGYGGSATGDMTFTQQFVSAVGVDEQVAVEVPLLIAPNPASQGFVQIFTDLKEPGLLSMLDLHGRLVAQQRLAPTNGFGAHQLDLGGLAPGLYTVRLDQGARSSATRLIVE